MSIIAEALKKAEKERNSSVNSREYIDKLLGPRIDISSYRKEPADESGADEVLTVSDKAKFGHKTAARAYGKIDWRISRRPLIILGILIIGAILFLSAVNMFVISSVDTKIAQSPRFTNPGKDHIEVETYTNAMYPDIAALERESVISGRLDGALKGGAATKDEFTSNFELNGIIYDADNSWAIINNKMVKIGDILNGAKILSISPQKTVLLYKDETFDLSVR